MDNDEDDEDGVAERAPEIGIAENFDVVRQADEDRLLSE